MTKGRVLGNVNLYTVQDSKKYNDTSMKQLKYVITTRLKDDHDLKMLSILNGDDEVYFKAKTLNDSGPLKEWLIVSETWWATFYAMAGFSGLKDYPKSSRLVPLRNRGFDNGVHASGF